MARKPKPPVERTRSGFRLNLQEEERDLVLRLMGELRALLLGPNEDDRLRRLFPTAYHQPGDQAMDDEYQRLMREDLVASRLTGLNLVDECLSGASGDSAPLSEAQLFAFVQALNGLRLVLGTMLDVGEDDDLQDIGDDHPLAGEHHLYGFLSWLLDWCIRALQS
ncbi:MAG: DUF2017 family protein [Actinomycetota bacterium]